MNKKISKNITWNNKTKINNKMKNKIKLNLWKKKQDCDNNKSRICKILLKINEKNQTNKQNYKNNKKKKKNLENNKNIHNQKVTNFK